MQVAVESQVNSQEFLRSWEGLLDKSLHDIGQRPSWIRTWLKYYGTTRHSPMILAGEVYEAIWPCIVQKKAGLRCLRWIGQADGMPTDYVFGLFRGEPKAEMSLLLDGLIAASQRWDVAALTIPPWQLGGGSLVECLAAWQGQPIFWLVEVHGGSVEISLPSSLDEWLSRLGRRTRADLRKYLRRATEIGANLELRFGSQAENALEHLFGLSATNWRIFRDSHNRAFLREVVRLETMPFGLFVATLKVGTDVMACVLGYLAQGRCFLHPAGVLRSQIDGLSPGMTMYALLVKEMMQRGVQTVDLSPGLEEYKFRLGGSWKPIHRVVFSLHKHCLHRLIVTEQVMRVGSLCRRILAHPFSGSG